LRLVRFTAVWQHTKSAKKQIWLTLTVKKCGNHVRL